MEEKIGEILGKKEKEAKGEEVRLQDKEGGREAIRRDKRHGILQSFKSSKVRASDHNIIKGRLQQSTVHP